MTRQENILTLNEHLEHWKRLLSENICDQNEGEKTIDALQNAIKALEQETCEDCIRRSDVGLTDFEIIMCNGDYREGLKILLEKIAAAPSVTPMQKWIPCSERLPEEHKEVLTCSLGGFIEIQSYEDGCGGYWENQKGDWTDLEEVTHWMQLPTPPNQPEIPTGAEGSEKND